MTGVFITRTIAALYLGSFLIVEFVMILLKRYCSSLPSNRQSIRAWVLDRIDVLRVFGLFHHGLYLKHRIYWGSF